MAGMESAQMRVTFEEVAVYFTPGQGALLGPAQRALYRDVMQENYEAVTSLGFPVPKPELIARLEQGEEPWVPDRQAGKEGEIPRGTRTGDETVSVKKEEDPHQEVDVVRVKVEETQYEDVPGKIEPQATFVGKTEGNFSQCLEQGEAWGNWLKPERLLGSHPVKKEDESVPCGAGDEVPPSQDINLKGEKHYYCLHCGKGFSERSHLVTHQTIHSGEKPLRCLAPANIFSNRSELDSSGRSHAGEDPDRCLKCWNCFIWKSMSTVPEATDREERPPVSLDCRESFRDQSEVNKHQPHHTAEQRQKCSDCGKSFEDETAVVAHQKIHTGERPHKCLDCGKSFKERSLISIMSNEEDEDKTHQQENKQETPTPSTSSATPPKKLRRICQYSSSWENLFSWVAMDDYDRSKARCKMCNTSFIIAYDGIKALAQHADSRKHAKTVQAAPASQRTNSSFVIKDSPQSDQVTVAELTHIYHGVKHHISFLAQDCSINVMKQVLKDSEIVKKMAAGCTIASAVVNNVLYPFSIELFLNDLKNSTPFSVATDASNKGNCKFFPVAVQYFTPQEGLCFKILDFYESAFEDPQSIKDQLCHVLNEKGLSWTNVSAYGADNTSVNYGVNNLVFQKLAEQENENIIAAHCINHILHNCAKYAFKVQTFDIENLVLKVFAEFSNSAKKREELKDFFEFCEVEFPEVLRHIPTRWLSLFNAVEQLLLNWQPLKAYFLSLGSDDCHVAIWNIISDQEDEMASDEQPTLSELYLYFTHYFMSQFQDTLLKLENRSTLSCDLYLIMEKFCNSLRKKIDDKFFGMKVTFAFQKDYLPVYVINKFTSEALNVYTRALKYLEKWFPFENSPYRVLSALSLANREKSPSFDEVIQIWMLSPWKKELPPISLYEELGALDMMFTSLEGTTSLDKWKCFFNKEPAAPNLLKLVQYCVSIPVSNAGVERIFSVMGNLWTDECNRLSLESVRSEICVFFNIPFTCLEAKDEFLKNKKLIKAAQSNVKYMM